MAASTDPSPEEDTDTQEDFLLKTIPQLEPESLEP